MVEFSVGDLPIVSISHDLFSDITADERFNVFNEWKVQRNEARKLEDIPCHKLDAILCRFFR